MPLSAYCCALRCRHYKYTKKSPFQLQLRSSELVWVEVLVPMGTAEVKRLKLHSTIILSCYHKAVYMCKGLKVKSLPQNSDCLCNYWIKVLTEMNVTWTLTDLQSSWPSTCFLFGFTASERLHCLFMFVYVQCPICINIMQVMFQ